MKSDAKSTIEAGKAILGIEFGSTPVSYTHLTLPTILRV